MFKVECLGCQAPYQVDERRVPEKGLKMRCPKCGTTFKVEPPAQAEASASQAPAPEPEVAAPTVPKAPFASGPFETGPKIPKPAGRDSLARTMIGVSSAELEAFSKDAAAGAAKPKPFRIPRPNEGKAEAPAHQAAAPAPAPVAPAPAIVAEPAQGIPFGEIGLPAPVRPRALGLSARGEEDAALPAVVDARRSAPKVNEVQVVAASVAPEPDPAWISGDEVSDAPASLAGPDHPLRLSELPQPVLGGPRNDAAGETLTRGKGSTLEIELEEDLPIVASAVKRPPPRRHRDAAQDAKAQVDEGVDLPARPEDIDIGLPAIAAPVVRPLERAPRPPPPRPKAASSLDELDLPAVAPRGAPPPAALPLAARAPAPREPAVARGAPTLADLPSAPRARPAPKGLSDEDLPAIGHGLPGPGKNRPPPPRAPMPTPAALDDDLPGVLGGAAALTPSDLPGVLGGAPAAGSDSDLPGVLGGAPAARSDSDLPGVLGGAVSQPDVIGLPEMLATGLPDLASGGLPSVASGRSGLPDVLGAGLPDISVSGLPDISRSGLPAFQETGLPDVLSAGLPEVSAAGLPDVLSAGLPTLTDAGLPEVFAPGVGGFGRVDLPLPRPAELPEVRAGHHGFDEVDLPGVGESLPSVAEAWNEANLPTVGEALPMAKNAFGVEEDSPFGAFEPNGESDPFAGSEADFGAPDGDPFGAPAGEFGDGGESSPLDAHGQHGMGGAGYGEVDIGSPESSASPIETADDMEFQAIPQRQSAPAPGRAAASASVHAEGPDTDAAGSTLELGPERKAPKQRTRRLAAMLAIGLGTIAGGALALKPTLGPFGIHFVMDQIKRGEHERVLAALVTQSHEAGNRDTLDGVRAVLRDLEKARELAPRYQPLSARSALDHYKAVLRFGPLPNLEAAAKVALDQLDPESDDELDRVARAAKTAAARSPEAKHELEALGTDLDARELLGELSLASRDWAGALNVWAELAKDPASARAAFGLARAELGLGKASEAFDGARRVLALNPAHVGAPILMLEARRALVNPTDAKLRDAPSTEELAAAVTRILPSASPGEAALAHCVLGELHASQGRSLPAQQEFEAALVIDRSLPRALVGLGEVLYQLGRHSEALARFTAAAQSEPSSLAAQLGLAKSQIPLAHLAEAKKLLTQLAAAHENQPDVIYWTARTNQALGENDAALAEYRASIVAGKGRAESVDAYLGLAKLQADLGQLALAQDTLTEAKEKLPPSGPLYNALGEIALTRAEYGAAYEQFQKALDLDAGDTRARFLGAVALTRLGRFDEALKAFQTVGQTDKDFPGLAVERGRLFEESGRITEALAEYEGALTKTPDDPEVQIRVGCARVLGGQSAAAEPLLDKAVKARPRSAEANYCLGRALFDTERYTDAAVRLERAISIDSTRAIYHLYSGWVASEMGRQGEAQKSFDEAIALDKGLADAYWQRGRLRLKQAAAKDAIVDLERARQLKPTRFDAIADLAVAYADIGRMPKALDLWEEAIARDADNPTWHFRYGKLLSSSGNGAMAAAHLKRAIDLLKEADASAPNGAKPKPPLWLWQAHYLLGRELGVVPAAIPHWQAYLRLSPHDDPYRPEAERALRDLGQPWAQR